MTESLGGIEAVVHLAAMSGVIDSIVDPVGCFACNVAGTFQLLEAVRRAKIKHFVNASTGGAILGDVTPPISEAMAPAPLSPYGASKLAAEGYCSAFSARTGYPAPRCAFPTSTVRIPPTRKAWSRRSSRRALDDEPLVVYGDGSQQRDYLYVGDLARGIDAAIERRVNGTFQLGSGRPTSILELVQALASAAGSRLNVEHEPARKGEVHSTWCDIAKARDAFGYAAPTELAAGLRDDLGLVCRQPILVAPAKKF